MDQIRIDLFRELTDDAKAELTHDHFTVSEIKEIIAETALTQLDRDIATFRYCECMTFDEIAERLDRTTVTIKRRLPEISLKLKATCCKLFMK